MSNNVTVIRPPKPAPVEYNVRFGGQNVKNYFSYDFRF